MQMNEKALRKMFVAMGYAQAEEWNQKRLLAKTVGLASLLDQANELEEKDDIQLQESVIKALEEGIEITIEGEEKVATEKSEKKGKKDKASATEKTKPTKPKKSSAEKDKFGSLVGSLANKANSVLSSKPKSMAQIKEEAGLASSMYNHLNGLAKEGKIIKSDEGYSLAKK